MSRPYSDTGLDVMLDALGAVALRASAHTAYPGNTGANEVVGAPYARQPVAWNPSAAGSKAATTLPVFPMPGGGTEFAWVGYWNVAGSAFYGSSPANGGIPAPFTAEDSTDLFTVDQHGLADGTKVVMWDTSGAVLPTPFVEGTIYFVRDATTDTFKLAATSGGVAIDVTADGAGFVQTIITETFQLPGSATVTSAILDLLR